MKNKTHFSRVSGLLALIMMASFLPIYSMATVEQPEYIVSDNHKILGGTNLLVIEQWDHGTTGREMMPDKTELILLEHDTMVDNVVMLDEDYLFGGLNFDGIYNIAVKNIEGYTTKIMPFQDTFMEVSSGTQVAYNGQNFIAIGDSNYVVVKLTDHGEHEFLVWKSEIPSAFQQRDFIFTFARSEYAAADGFDTMNLDNTIFIGGNGATFEGLTFADGAIAFAENGTWTQFIYGDYHDAGKQVEIVRTRIGLEQPEEPSQPETPEEPGDSLKHNIVVKKTVEGQGVAVETLPKDFAITLQNGEQTITLTVDRAITKDNKTVKWQVNDLPAGKYTVTESGYEIDGYQCTATVPTEEVDVQSNGIQILLNNRYDLKSSDTEDSGGGDDEAELPNEDIPLAPKPDLPDSGNDGSKPGTDGELGNIGDDVIILPNDMPKSDLPATGTTPVINMWTNSMLLGMILTAGAAITLKK